MANLFELLGIDSRRSGMSTITKEWLQQAINDYESVRDELTYRGKEQ